MMKNSVERRKKMFMCKVCGILFDEPDKWYDDPSAEGVSLVNGSYEYYECPECGSDDFVEAKECPRCGEHYTDEKILCDNCMDELGMELREIKGRFHMTEDDFEQAIAEWFGW